LRGRQILSESHLFQRSTNTAKKEKKLALLWEPTDKKTEATGAENTASVDGQRKIRGDDSNMRSVYANACNVAGTREKVVLFFCMNQAWHSAQAEVTIRSADGIVLGPFVAKCLSHAAQ